MIANTLEQYRAYTGEETFSRIKPYETLAKMWEERSAEYAGLTAVSDDGKEYTFAALADDVADFRAVLKPRIAEKSRVFRAVLKPRIAEKSRVAILLPNSYDFVKAFLAVVTLGCTAAVLPAHLDEKAVAGTRLMFGYDALITLDAQKASLCPDLTVISPSVTSGEKCPAAECDGK